MRLLLPHRSVTVTVDMIANAKVENGFVTCDVRLTDQSWLTSADLFTDDGAGPRISGLLTFSGSSSDIFMINDKTGAITILKDSTEPQVVTISSAEDDSVTADVVFIPGTTKAVGQVSLTIAARQGTAVTMAVTVNAGSSAVRAAHLVAAWDQEELDLTHVTPGPGWPGGLFSSSTRNARGTIEFGGPCTSFSGNVSVAMLHFTTRTLGVASVRAWSKSLTDAAGVSAFDGAAPAPGTGEVARRSRRTGGPATCDSDVSPNFGDVNGDCIFSMADVAAVQASVAQRGPQPVPALPATDAAMDTDGNGWVDQRGKRSTRDPPSFTQIIRLPSYQPTYQPLAQMKQRSVV